MEQQLANVLPFLAARLNTPIEKLATQPVKAVMHLFGRHAILFLREIAADPARAEAMTAAEISAWPAIKEVAALVGIHAG